MKSKKILIFAIALMLTIGIILACKTPVYKYAILNWAQRDYYQILRIYDSTKNQVDIEPSIKKAFEGKVHLTNVGIIPVDISQDLTQIYGEEFKTFLKENMGDSKPPFHILLNPKKNVVYTGDFKEEDVEPLIMSPKRKELAEKLSVGNVCLILMESKDAEKNKKAHEILKKGIEKSIDIDLEIRSAGEDPSHPIDKKTLTPLKVAYVSVSPTDKNETWFVRQMQKLNSKIPDDNEPKVFGIVGRGFVFEQSLGGEYLTEEQLQALILFLSGPCSCTVKAENAGIDIITCWDWDKNINVKLEPGEEDDENPSHAPGFGGEEVNKQSSNKNEKSSEKKSTDTKNTTAKSQSKKTDNSNSAKLNADTPVNESEFLKTILFAIGGIAVVLIIITKLMKADKE